MSIYSFYSHRIQEKMLTRQQIYFWMILWAVEGVGIGWILYHSWFARVFFTLLAAYWIFGYTYQLKHGIYLQKGEKRNKDFDQFSAGDLLKSAKRSVSHGKK